MTPAVRAVKAVLRCGRLVGVCLLGGIGLAEAQTADPFTVRGIEVDETAADAVAARAAAIETAQDEGLRRLLERLTPEWAHGDLPDVQPLDANRYVASFSVDQEELSSTQYIGSLSVRYLDEPVRELLRERRVPFTDAVAPPRVVVPIFEGERGLRLWEGENPWLMAWERKATSAGLVPFVVPLADLEDAVLLPPDRAPAFGQPALEAFARRYGAQATLVTQATRLPSGPDGAERVRVVARSTEPGSGPGIDSVVQGATLEEALDAAADQVDAWQSTAWKSANLLRVDEMGSIVMTVPLATLSDWTRVDQILGSVAEVDDVDVLAFSRREARLQVNYLGSLDRLRTGLLAAGLSMMPEGDGWLLQPTTGPAPLNVPVGVPVAPSPT